MKFNIINKYNYLMRKIMNIGKNEKKILKFLNNKKTIKVKKKYVKEYLKKKVLKVL